LLASARLCEDASAVGQACAAPVISLLLSLAAGDLCQHHWRGLGYPLRATFSYRDDVSPQYCKLEQPQGSFMYSAQYTREGHPKSGQDVQRLVVE